MVIRLLAGSTDTRRDKSNCNAKSTTTPHRRSTVLVEYPNESIGSWGELESQFARNFCSIYKRPASLEEVKACVQRKGEALRSNI
jgi:hypothetical protein